MNTERHLWIMRHAKSAWPEDEPDDMRRPLSKRGKHDANKAGLRLARQEPVPQIIVSSPARRARSTAKRVGKALPDVDLVTDPRLYGCGPEACLQVAKCLETRHAAALLVGHNPDLEQLVAMLTGSQIAMTTSTVVHLRFEASQWRDIGSRNSTLLSITDRHQPLAP